MVLKLRLQLQLRLARFRLKETFSSSFAPCGKLIPRRFWFRPRCWSPRCKLGTTVVQWVYCRCQVSPTISHCSFQCLRTAAMQQLLARYFHFPCRYTIQFPYFYPLSLFFLFVQFETYPFFLISHRFFWLVYDTGELVQRTADHNDDSLEPERSCLVMSSKHLVVYIPIYLPIKVCISLVLFQWQLFTCP